MKNTDTAEHKGYDAGKKVSGVKRHIAVDTQGLPHAVAVTTAEITDRKGALEAMRRCKANLERAESVLADGGYVGQPFEQAVQVTLGATVQIAKRSELHTFTVMPQRWAVSAPWLARKVPTAMEELRAKAQHQSAIHPSGFPCAAVEEILNRLLEVPLFALRQDPS